MMILLSMNRDEVFVSIPYKSEKYAASRKETLDCGGTN